MKLKKECSNKVNGSCPLHNIHCQYPDCEDAGEIPYDVGNRVRDVEGQTGIIEAIHDAHNVQVTLDDGGSALYCVDKECEDREELKVLDTTEELKRMSFAVYVMPKMMNLLEFYHDRAHIYENLFFEYMMCPWWNFIKRRSIMKRIEKEALNTEKLQEAKFLFDEMLGIVSTEE